MECIMHICGYSFCDLVLKGDSSSRLQMIGIKAWFYHPFSNLKQLSRFLLFFSVILTLVPSLINYWNWSLLIFRYALKLNNKKWVDKRINKHKLATAPIGYVAHVTSQYVIGVLTRQGCSVEKHITLYVSFAVKIKILKYVLH